MGGGFGMTPWCDDLVCGRWVGEVGYFKGRVIGFLRGRMVLLAHRTVGVSLCHKWGD